jgi:hypothetical protein
MSGIVFPMNGNLICLGAHGKAGTSVLSYLARIANCQVPLSFKRVFNAQDRPGAIKNRSSATANPNGVLL